MLEKLKQVKALRIAAICVITYLLLGTFATGGLLAMFGDKVSVGVFLKMVLAWPKYVWFVISVILHGF